MKHGFALLGGVIALAGGILLLCPPAWAARGVGGSFGAMRDDPSTEPQLIRVEGRLSCDMGEVNQGQGCTPRLTDAKTGRIYQLDGREVLRAYFDGARNVSIEGTPDGDTLRVRSLHHL